MMELVLVKKVEKADAVHEVYHIGSYHVDVCNYLDEDWTSITVSADPNEKYLPEIYFDETVNKFEIQTTSYGLLSTEDIQKVIKGYEEAIKVVEVLTKELIK